MARLRYGEPRLEIFCLVPVNSPDCVTRTSSPAKATNLLGASKRWMSPISLKIIAPRVSPMPGMVVI